MLCMKCSYPIDVVDVLPCHCGRAWQSREGWDAQGLCEDVEEKDGTWSELYHNLAPKRCEKIRQDGTKEYFPSPTTALMVVTRDGTRPGDAAPADAAAPEGREESVGAPPAPSSAGCGLPQGADPVS